MLDFPDTPPLPSVVAKNPDVLKTVDKRLSYDQGSSQWLFEMNKDNKSTEYYYNFILERWIPKTESEDSDRKRSHEDDEETINEEEEENKLAIRNLKKQKLKEMKEQMNKAKTDGNNNRTVSENTGIYISQLPEDITKDELMETFSKYGLISEDYKTGEPRIKIYRNDSDDKRDALIIYHSKESVSLAIEILDDSFIRPPSDKEQSKIKVQPAEFKKTDSDNSNERKKILTHEEKKLLNRKKEMMKKKLSNWDADEGAVQGEEQDKTNNIKRRIWDKTVVIENMFRLEELKSDPLLEMDLKEDIQDECNKLNIGNDVTKITIYDVSGIITVKFNSNDLSLKCIESFSGRYYDGLTLKAYLYQGEKFQKTDLEKGSEGERLNNFGNWLEKK